VDGSFCRVSGAVLLSEPPPDDLDARALLTPSVHHPTVSRVVLHEALHHWQVVGSGYLARLAAEDWARLGQHLRTGDVPPVGDRRRDFTRRDADGFSVRDLQEALARFWDVHVLDPVELVRTELDGGRRAVREDLRERFERLEAAGLLRHPTTGAYSGAAYALAMETAAGTYARPYLHAKELVGPAADVVFPLAGYLALQSDDPVDAFTTLLRTAAPSLRPAHGEHVVHELWRQAFPVTVAVYLRHVSDRAEHLWSVVAEGLLDGHPVWPLVARLRRTAAAQWLGAPPPIDLSGAPDDPHARAACVLEYVLACPGDPGYRPYLVRRLAPAALVAPEPRGEDEHLGAAVRLVRFGAQCAHELAPLGGPVDDALDGVAVDALRDAAAGAADVRAAWTAFLRAGAGYGTAVTRR
jgi:hypothetical protein